MPEVVRIKDNEWQLTVSTILRVCVITFWRCSNWKKACVLNKKVLEKCFVRGCAHTSCKQLRKLSFHMGFFPCSVKSTLLNSLKTFLSMWALNEALGQQESYNFSFKEILTGTPKMEQLTCSEQLCTC